MGRRTALVVGIDNYRDRRSNLTGCVNDARRIAELLSENEAFPTVDDPEKSGLPGTRSLNFHVNLVVGDPNDGSEVSAEMLDRLVHDAFSAPAELLVIYFAGHGYLSPELDGGFLVASDGRAGGWGMPLDHLLALANRAHRRIQSTVILLDCCHAGSLGDAPQLGDSRVSPIGQGVTLLAACSRHQVAYETAGSGIFSGLIADGLAGGAADILGRVSAASLYAYVDQSLGASVQRPTFRANVSSFDVLRTITPLERRAALLLLPRLFREENGIYELGPADEPDRGQFANKYRKIKPDPRRVKIYRQLQAMNRIGLVVPHEQPNMWHAAMFCTGCKLTAKGRHIRRLALGKLI
jgi:hypothetical protein